MRKMRVSRGSHWRVRRAERLHAVVILELRKRFLTEFVQEHQSDMPLTCDPTPELAQETLAVLENPDVAVFVTEEANGAVSGMVVANIMRIPYYLGVRGAIGSLYVDQAHRTGYRAHALLSEAADWFRTNGVSIVQITQPTDSKLARYEAHRGAKTIATILTIRLENDDG